MGTDSAYPPFLGMPTTPTPRRRRHAALLPIPYDLTASYRRGAHAGPGAILDASAHLETFDEELGVETWEEIGIHTLAPVLPQPEGAAATLRAVERAAAEVVARDRFLVGLGGEHAVTAPLVRAVRSRYPGLGVLQLDAHADLRDRFDETPHSHACVMRRLMDAGVPLAQVGIRSLSQEERGPLAAAGVCTVFAPEAVGEPVAHWLPRVLEALPEEVYVTVDLDVLDPGIMPATGTPEPGGLDWYQTLQILRAVARAKRVVAFDVVELAPIPGLVAPDFLAAKLLYRLLGYVLAS